jgi:hypothetical protein
MTFTLPVSDHGTPLLRTDNGSADRWNALLECIARPSLEGFLAEVVPVTDPALDGLTDEAVRRLARSATGPFFALVADAVAQGHHEFPILVVDLSGRDRPSFRVTCRWLWSVENNLSLANMAWEEFAESVDPDGVFRGW